MYGIKIYIHDATPPKKKPKFLKALGFIAALLLYSIFAIAGFYCEGILTSGLLFICPLTVIAALFLQAADFAKPYLVFTKTTVERHTFVFGIHRIKYFKQSDISEILKCSSHSQAVKGIRINRFQYLVFRNKNGKYMFKLAVFENTGETVHGLLPNIQIKEVS